MCALYVGDQNQVVFHYESGTYGSKLVVGSLVSGLWIGLVTEHSPSEEENVTQIRYTGTTNRNYGQQLNLAKDYEGTLTYHPQDFRLFGMALGSVVDSGSPSPYSHVISEVNSDDGYAFFPSTSNQQFPSFTIVDSKKSAGGDGEHQIREYNGCVINSLSFTASQGEPVTCEVSYMAQALVVGSKTTDIPNIFDEDTSRPYIWSDTKFHQPSGTVFNETTEVAWTINNNSEKKHYDNGSKVVQNITPLNREYEVSLTMDANSTRGPLLYDQWQNGTSFNCMIESVLSTGSETGYFIMSGCKITNFESPSPSEGINEYSITITPQNCVINTDDLLFKHNPA